MSTYNKTTAYSGDEPFIFVSYSHKDSEQVLPIITKLQEKDFRVWFDQGIEAGTEWPQYIAEHLYASACVLVFMSPNAANSHNCTREIHFAIELKKDPIVIHLESFEMPLGMRMQLNCLQAMYRERSETLDIFVNELTNSKKLKVCKGEPIKQYSKDEKYDLKKILDGINNIKKVERLYTIDEIATDFNISKEYLVNALAKVFGYKKDSQTILTKDELNFCFDFITIENSVQSFDEFFNITNNENTNIAPKTEEAKITENCVKVTGVKDAQLYLETGDSYIIKGDIDKAITNYRLAAQMGNVEAQYNMGVYYYIGNGVEKNPKEAAKWYKLAAEQGHAEAQRSLGLCYYMGDGVEENRNEAKKWFNLSAEQGNKLAKEVLKILS